MSPTHGVPDCHETRASLTLRCLAPLTTLAMLLAIGGCPGAIDSETPDVQVDAASDTATDLGDDGGPSDAADVFDVPDVSDVSSDVANDTDTHIPVVTAVAVPGERCLRSNRIGSVQVWFGEGQAPSIYATLTDRLHPWYGPPAIQNSTCAYYEYTDTCGGTCVAGEICSHDGVCTAGPLNLGATTVAISTLDIPGDSTVAGETIWMPESFDGGSWGEFDLPGDAFSARVIAPGYDIRVAPMSVPVALESLNGTISGTENEPTAVDITWFWSGPGDFGSVYTSIAINHHAGGPSFTECAVGVESQQLHIEGDVLVPLAVSTGLEFQNVEFARFAAAQTPAGCVEFRFAQRTYLDLVPPEQ